MKFASIRILPAFFLILLFNVSLRADEGGGEEVRLLMVGNSFSLDASRYLPGLAQAARKKLILENAVLAGGSLQQHVKGIKAYEADPEGNKGRIYTERFLKLAQGEGPKSLRDLLVLKPWNYVSIQQVSALSFKEESYEPFAHFLVEYIRKFIPEAKLLVHQTWAYREDSDLLRKASLTPETMYLGLSAAYTKLAQAYAAEIVPVGLAFQTARQTERWKFHYPDPDFDYAAPSRGRIPKQKGSLNVGWEWKKREGEPEPVFTLDAKHANRDGQYLGACVFFEVLFGESVVGNTFVPEKIAPGDARMLQEIAHAVVAQFRAKPKVLLTGSVALPKGE